MAMATKVSEVRQPREHCPGRSLLPSSGHPGRSPERTLQIPTLRWVETKKKIKDELPLSEMRSPNLSLSVTNAALK